MQFCHSEGAIITRNALMLMPKDLRERIMVVAIAPAAYIDRRLCHSVHHYISRRDFIPFFDLKGLARNIDTVTMLKPHPNAEFHDHNFDSPTYQNKIKYHIDLYKSNTRGI